MAAVCFFWGTTYLGIRIALESFPPLLLMGLRFLLSGSILLAYAKIAGDPIPSGRELRMTALYGVILLGGGTGGLTFAEQLIPSGLAVLFITTSPFWMVGVESLIPGGARLHAPTIAGMAVGFAGVLMLLLGGAETGAQGGTVLKGFLILQAGCFCWALGSILQRRLKTTANPVIGGAAQQFATGVCFLVAAAIAGQTHANWNLKGLAAVAYLVTFGSIVGYSSYAYALDRLPVAVVSMYTYVNPIVAVFLGWLVYHEHFGRREALAMVIIFLGVALVKRSTSR